MNNIRTVILFAAMSASLWSCGTGIVRHDDDPTPSVEKLEIRASTTVIEADGTDAVQLEVLADGVPVTEGVRLYDGATNLAIELPSMTFTTTEPGTYYFWAAYGTAHTEQLKVTAVGFDLPSLPECSLLRFPYQSVSRFHLLHSALQSHSLCWSPSLSCRPLPQKFRELHCR